MLGRIASFALIAPLSRIACLSSITRIADLHHLSSCRFIQIEIRNSKALCIGVRRGGSSFRQSHCARIAHVAIGST